MIPPKPVFDLGLLASASITQRKAASVASGIIGGMLFVRYWPDMAGHLMALIDWITRDNPSVVMWALLGVSAVGSAAKARKRAKEPKKKEGAL